MTAWAAMVVIAACGETSRPRLPAADEGGMCEGCGGEPAPQLGGEAGDQPAPPATGSGGAPDASPPVQPQENAAGAGGLASGVRLRSISVSQTLELQLMQEGKSVDPAERSIPLIAGKKALVRAFVDVDEAFAPRELLGVLDVKTAGRAHSLLSRRRLSQSSLQDELDTSFVFDVAPGDLAADTSYRMRILEADTTPLARFPEQGYVPLQAKVVAPFQVVLIPFVANGFRPKTTELELRALEQRLLALYPVSEVQVTQENDVLLDFTVNADGDGWDEALDRVYQLRSEAHPPSDAFYFGMLAPEASYDDYCRDGCILGYSLVADASDVDARGSLGVTVFPDGTGTSEAWDTVAHELGHALGREHAPCGIHDSSIDPEWPEDPAHKNAAVGQYGFDFDTLELIKPRSRRDVMSYCSPVWISDYMYEAISQRLDYIESHTFSPLAFVPPKQFRLARIHRDGSTTWLGQRPKRGLASSRQVPLLDAAGNRVEVVTAQVSFIDHARGAYVWLAAEELSVPGAASVDLRPLGGDLLPL
ncbi:MAG TPA: hypothetical protein VHB79_23820 [Polyangiaceae bacterium]|nr:hypothetical protein [Polyangiaceae bacterium]